MASLALRGFASIASKAPGIFRSIWSTIKSSPALSSIKDAIIGQLISKGTAMVQQNVSNKSLRNIWDVSKKQLRKSVKKNKRPQYLIKKI